VRWFSHALSRTLLDMNRLELIGIVVWPVEIRSEQVTGRPFARAMLAVSRGVDGMDFVPLTLWDREAEDAARYVGEGSLVAVEGHVRSTLQSDRDTHGTSRTRRMVSVVADRVTYLRLRAPGAGNGR
jgi:single-strand DNA-binding protein